MDIESIFKADEFYFRLSVPEYEIPVFGYKIGELRRVFLRGDESFNVVDLSELRTFLNEIEIRICTFRGEEDITVTRLLQDLGFLFVGTYKTVECEKKSFKKFKINSDLQVTGLDVHEFDQVIELENDVMDFSTFQLDLLVDASISALRNVERVKSYFNRSNHKIFVMRNGETVIGFLQFLVDTDSKIAECVNGAIHKNFQNLFFGPILYSESFNNVFKLGIEKIIGGFSTQNTRVNKLFSQFNFRITDEEIHLRLFCD
jgi:ribosomal protein S18 acetylase RimI-like enzyme